MTGGCESFFVSIFLRFLLVRRKWHAVTGLNSFASILFEMTDFSNPYSSNDLLTISSTMTPMPCRCGCGWWCPCCDLPCGSWWCWWCCCCCCCWCCCGCCDGLGLGVGIRWIGGNGERLGVLLGWWAMNSERHTNGGRSFFVQGCSQISFIVILFAGSLWNILSTKSINSIGTRFDQFLEIQSETSRFFYIPADTGGGGLGFSLVGKKVAFMGMQSACTTRLGSSKGRQPSTKQ